MTYLPFSSYVQSTFKIIKKDYMVCLPFILLMLIVFLVFGQDSSLPSWGLWALELFFKSVCISFLFAYFLVQHCHVKFALSHLSSRLIPLLLNAIFLYLPILMLRPDQFILSPENLLEQSPSILTLLFMLIVLIPVTLLIHFMPIIVLFSPHSKYEYILETFHFIRSNWRPLIRICLWLMCLSVCGLWIMALFTFLPVPVNYYVMAFILGLVKTAVTIISVLFYRSRIVGAVELD